VRPLAREPRGHFVREFASHRVDAAMFALRRYFGRQELLSRSATPLQDSVRRRKRLTGAAVQVQRGVTGRQVKAELRMC